jgi:hypothetical protein
MSSDSFGTPADSAPPRSAISRDKTTTGPALQARLVHARRIVRWLSTQSVRESGSRLGRAAALGTGAGAAFGAAFAARLAHAAFTTLATAFAATLGAAVTTAHHNTTSVLRPRAQGSRRDGRTIRTAGQCERGQSEYGEHTLHEKTPVEDFVRGADTYPHHRINSARPRARPVARDCT